LGRSSGVRDINGTSSTTVSERSLCSVGNKVAVVNGDGIAERFSEGEGTRTESLSDVGGEVGSLDVDSSTRLSEDEVDSTAFSFEVGEVGVGEAD